MRRTLRNFGTSRALKSRAVLLGSLPAAPGRDRDRRFPLIPMVPTGGVNLETAADYIRAGAAALGVGGEMIAKDALKARDGDVISKLAALFVDLVRDARKKQP